LALSLGVSAIFWSAFLIAVPETGPSEQLVPWTQTEQRDAVQSALSSALSNNSAILASARDTSWLKPGEADLVGYTCDGRSVAGVLDVVTEQDCPPGTSGR
jgi:hypothetical protein